MVGTRPQYGSHHYGWWYLLVVVCLQVSLCFDWRPKHLVTQVLEEDGHKDLVIPICQTVLDVHMLHRFLGSYVYMLFLIVLTKGCYSH